MPTRQLKDRPSKAIALFFLHDANESDRLAIAAMKLTSQGKHGTKRDRALATTAFGLQHDTFANLEKAVEIDPSCEVSQQVKKMILP